MTSSSFILSNQLLVGEMLKRASHKTPNKIAFTFENDHLTFQQMDDRATQLAGWLQSQGIMRDDKVGFFLKNSLEFVEVAFGVVLSGGVGVPINYRLSAREATYIINNSDSKLLFIHEEFVEIVKSIRGSLEKVETIVVVGSGGSTSEFTSYETAFNTEVIYKPCEPLTDNDAAFIVYTSGTTGKPKGAVLTHKNICQNSMNMMWESELDLFDSQLICVPQFHIAGLLLTMLTCLTSGKTVIQSEFNPMNVLYAIEQEQINNLFLVPTMWNYLFQVPNIEEFDLSSVKNSITGAAISPLTLKEKILKHFPSAKLIDHFGQSETTATTTALKGQDALRKPSSVGRPYINVEIRILDENMSDVSVGEVGEIVYRGPTVMKEYYKNPEATREAFRSGWFHSGDLVRMDDEGFIYVVDREKDMLISGGENIYPAEVEEVLYQMPEILECAVVGVPDKEWGESCKAYIVLKPGMKLTFDEVVDYCAERLASFKKPREVEFIDQLPRNVSGKVLKFVLRDGVKQS